MSREVSMEIQRIDTYRDSRFSQRVLNQHGCFLVGDVPYEVEVVSGQEAVIRGRNPDMFSKIIEEFRFYAPHITVFFNENLQIVREFPPANVFRVRLEDIQPSQFYVDEDKLEAVSTFIRCGEDITVQVMPQGQRYISLDGHTRLFYAAKMGWTSVNAVMAESGDSIYGFVEEAITRNIRTPYDLKLLNHREYEEKWNQFCDDYFLERAGKNGEAV